MLANSKFGNFANIELKLGEVETQELCIFEYLIVGVNSAYLLAKYHMISYDIIWATDWFWSQLCSKRLTELTNISQHK